MKIILFITCCCFTTHYASTANEDGNETKLEDLNIYDLLIFAWKNESARPEANQIFLQNYGQTDIEITAVSTRFLFWNNRLLIDYDISEKFVQIFGGSISNLIIEFVYIPRRKHREIAEFVNEYCSDTLLQFASKMCTERTFDGVQKPFKNVTNVIFSGEWMELSENAIGLNALFPEMRYLTLNYSAGYILEHHYPQLSELNLIAPNRAYAKLFEMNPQVKKLQITECFAEFLYIASVKLPNLESLIFDMPKDLQDYREPMVQFESLKNVSITDFYHYLRADKIAFRNLERLELFVDENIDDELINFLKRTDGQKSIIVAMGNISDSVYTELPNDLDSLIEVRIDCNLGEIKSVVQFLENNIQMERLLLGCPRNSTEFIESLTTQLDKKWEIVSVDNNKSKFSLKNAIENSVQNTTESNNANVFGMGSYHQLIILAATIFLCLFSF